MEMIPRILATDIDGHVSEGVSHVAFILRSLSGHVVLVRPDKNPYGITATLPRVRLNPMEQPANGLSRYVSENLGIEAHSVYPLTQVWVTSNSTTAGFAGFNNSIADVSSHLPLSGEWHTLGRAKELIMASLNASTRQRDLCLLEAAIRICLSPYRRIFLMVHELHALGFERLRVVPGMSPSGCSWRCAVLPASCVRADHGATISRTRKDAWQQALGYDFLQYTYLSGQDQEPFGWTDAHFDTPRELALKFIQRLREVAFSGWGSDPRYAHWYKEMLAITEPNGLFYAYADYSLPDDYLPTLMLYPEARVPLPPGGEAQEESEQ